MNRIRFSFPDTCLLLTVLGLLAFAALLPGQDTPVPADAAEAAPVDTPAADDVKPGWQEKSIFR